MVILDSLWASYPRLVLYGVEDFVDGEPQWSEVLLHLKARGGFGKRTGNVFLL